MKRKLFTLGCCVMLLMAALLTSCKTDAGTSSNVQQGGGTLHNIGDVLLSDGSVVSYKKISDEQKAKAVAVVCGLTANGKTVGLGLKQSEEQLEWAAGSTTGFNTKFTDIICTPSQNGKGAANNATFGGDTDGSDNWKVICRVDSTGTTDAAKNYPAFNWVNKYGETYKLPTGYQDGWYMPSIYEFTEYIYKNREIINKALNALGEKVATPLIIGESYWSSSQCDGTSWENASWLLGLGSAQLLECGKYYRYWVRCIRAF